MKTFNLVFVSCDGSHVTDSKHKTVEDAEKAFEYIGSKWYFYPVGFILSGSRVIETGQGLLRMSDKKAYSELMFKGRKLSTVLKTFKKTFDLCKNDYIDGYRFEVFMIETNRNLIR